MPDLLDRTCGVLLGTALGDAFGAPFEGANTGALDAEIDNRARRPRAWKYTDDTQMTLAVARSLANERELKPNMLLAELARSFDPARGYGRGTRRSIEAFLRGTPWNECAFVTWEEGSAGNGSAARVSPIACCYHDDADALVAAASLSSRTTHAHPDAITGAVLQAVATAVALRLAPDKFSPVDFIDRVSRYQVGGWAAAKLDVLRKLIENNATATQVVDALGNGVLAEQAVPAALWAFMHGARSFERCVRAAATLGGDVDTICAMSGALAGALCGGSRLPAHWIANLAHERPGVEEIEDVARSLLGGITLC